MPSFGILTLNLSAEQEYFKGISNNAVKSGFTCYLFSPESILPNKETVSGLQYCSDIGDWKKQDFPLPEVIYDRCFYENEQMLKKYSPIIKWLKSRKDLIFLGMGLPNKIVIYEDLMENPQIAPYLPETRLVQNVKEVLTYIRKKQSILLKPVFGSGGLGIFMIKGFGEKYIVKTVKNSNVIEKELSPTLLQKWLKTLLSRYTYLVQPYLQLVNNNHPFDIRIVVQKDELGKWCVRGKGVRIGAVDGIISNLTGGGQPYPFNEWLKQFPIEKRKYIETELEELETILPEILEKSYHRLFEIGIDISMDEKGAIWLLEVNSKPGRSVLLSLQPELKETLFQAPVLYAQYLLNTSAKGDTKNEEILSN